MYIMDTDSVLSFFISCFRRIYQLGEDIIINRSFNVSLNAFLIAIFLVGIVLKSILNFASSAGGGLAAQVSNKNYGYRYRQEERMKKRAAKKNS